MRGGKFVFREVSRHPLLTDFYHDAELEISKDWTKTSGVFFSEAVFCVEENGKTLFYQDGDMLGAYSLSRRFGITVLDYVAVKRDARKNGVGSVLMRRIKEKCREQGMDKIYLTAKAHDFFIKNGGRELSCDFPLYSELLGECNECPQRGSVCFPTVMEIDVRS